MLVLSTSVSGLSVMMVAVFVACAVEMVEALTIIVAVGHTTGWRHALRGAAVALLALAVIVGAFGPALIHIPLNILRLVVGGVLLVFGLQWLRKAILRSTGFKAKHDEDEIFRETVAEIEAVTDQGQRERVAFVMAFKGVFLEGLEVVITVLTLGTSARHLSLAIATAVGALVLVTLIGLVVARQLSSVPENAMKMTVGIMLVAYGTFWSGEGLKVSWPGNDAMLLGLVALYAVVVWAMVAIIKSIAPVKVSA